MPAPPGARSSLRAAWRAFSIWQSGARLPATSGSPPSSPCRAAEGSGPALGRRAQARLCMRGSVPPTGAGRRGRGGAVRAVARIRYAGAAFRVSGMRAQKRAAGKRMGARILFPPAPACPCTRRASGQRDCPRKSRPKRASTPGSSPCLGSSAGPVRHCPDIVLAGGGGGGGGGGSKSASAMSLISALMRIVSAALSIYRRVSASALSSKYLSMMPLTAAGRGARPPSMCGRRPSRARIAPSTYPNSAA